MLQRKRTDANRGLIGPEIGDILSTVFGGIMRTLSALAHGSQLPIRCSESALTGGNRSLCPRYNDCQDIE